MFLCHGPYMDARRFLLSFKSASRTTRIVGIALLLLGVGGSFVACAALGGDEESSSDALSQDRNGRLPYTMHNYIK